MFENEEEMIKTQFIDKLLKTKKPDTYFATKIFEEYVKCKNSVNIYLQTNELNKNINKKKHQKNINKYNNIKFWIKLIIKPEENDNNTFISKKSYSYANIKSDQVPKPIGDDNFPLLYYFQNEKNVRNSIIYSTTSNIFNITNFEEKNEEIFYNDEMIKEKLRKYYLYSKDDFVHFMQLGLPNSLRLIIWNIVNNISFSNEITYVINNTIFDSNDLYKQNLLKILEKTKSDLIYRDIRRTFPLQNYDSINKSKKANDEKSLYNVLKAFWNIDEEIGYCQGMNYLTGFLLLISDFDERNAYFLLISIFSQSFIRRKKNNFSLRGLFIEEFPLLYFYIFIFDDLLLKYIPQLRKHLIDNEIPNDVWIIKWFQTAFTMILPINWSKKLWDNIFSSDFFFIIKFSISLCISLSKDILALNDQQKIMDYFRNIQKIPMNFNNIFLEKKFDINDLIEKAQKINIDVDEYLNKYEKSGEKGKKFKEIIYKINDIKYFDININENNVNNNTNNNFCIKKTNTTVKEREKGKNKNNIILPNVNNNAYLLNDISIITKNGSNKLLKFPKNSLAKKSNSSDINSIKFNSNKGLRTKYKISKKPENQNLTKVDFSKKLIIKNKFSNSNLHNNSNNKNDIIIEMGQKNNSPRILNNNKNKEIIISSTESKKNKLVIQTKPFNFSKINNNTSYIVYNNTSNINNISESMNTLVNKNHYQKILYKRKKNMGNIPKSGFSSSNIKKMQKKKISNKANEIKDLLNSTKKNLSKEMHGNNNKDNDIKIKNTIMKNKMASIAILHNKNNLENNSRNNLINELKRRKQYLNKQVKYYLTNDSSKYSNNSFLNSDKKKILNSSSNSKNNIKENEKNNNQKPKQINRNTKPTKYIKIHI